MRLSCPHCRKDGYLSRNYISEQINVKCPYCSKFFDIVLKIDKPESKVPPEGSSVSTSSTPEAPAEPEKPESKEGEGEEKSLVLDQSKKESISLCKGCGFFSLGERKSCIKCTSTDLDIASVTVEDRDRVVEKLLDKVKDNEITEEDFLKATEVI